VKGIMDGFYSVKKFICDGYKDDEAWRVKLIAGLCGAPSERAENPSVIPTAASLEPRTESGGRPHSTGTHTGTPKSIRGRHPAAHPGDEFKLFTAGITACLPSLTNKLRMRT
jgi:hypothetical protein